MQKVFSYKEHDTSKIHFAISKFKIHLTNSLKCITIYSSNNYKIKDKNFTLQTSLVPSIRLSFKFTFMSSSNGFIYQVSGDETSVKTSHFQTFTQKLPHMFQAFLLTFMTHTHTHASIHACMRACMYIYNLHKIGVPMIIDAYDHTISDSFTLLQRFFSCNHSTLSLLTSHLSD